MTEPKINYRRLDWHIATYFEEELMRRNLGESIQNPTGRMRKDGGINGGEFKSKVPHGVQYTDIGLLTVYVSMNGHISVLKKVNSDWHNALVAGSKYRDDASKLSEKQAAELLGVAHGTYRHHRLCARKWLAKRLDCYLA